MEKRIRFSILTYSFCALLLIPGICRAQIELSSGIDLSYPLLLGSNNTIPNYGQISFGIRFGVAYKPENTQFFPILTAAYGRTRLPLKQFGKDVAALNFNYLNVMLNENYIIRFEKSEVFLYGGIGFTYLAEKSTAIGGPSGQTMEMTIDSTANITKYFPAINLGFEYVYGESTGKDLYLSMGFNFQYVLLLDGNNTYSYTIKNPSTGYTFYKTSLAGNLITPNFYISIHYLVHHK